MVTDFFHAARWRRFFRCSLARRVKKFVMVAAPIQIIALRMMMMNQAREVFLLERFRHP